LKTGQWYNAAFVPITVAGQRKIHTSFPLKKPKKIPGPI